jgi:hypothetical protein
MPSYYRLNGTDYEAVPGPEGSEPLRRTEYDGVSVSTIFLGLDHNFTAVGPPVLFESMVFGGSLDGEQIRSTSYDSAMKTHDRLVRRVFGGPRPDTALPNGKRSRSASSQPDEVPVPEVRRSRFDRI